MGSSGSRHTRPLSPAITRQYAACPSCLPDFKAGQKILPALERRECRESRVFSNPHQPPPHPRLHLGGFPREVGTPAPEMAVARAGTNFQIRVVCWGGVLKIFKEIVTKLEALWQVWIHQPSVMKWHTIWLSMNYWKNAKRILPCLKSLL